MADGSALDIQVIQPVIVEAFRAFVERRGAFYRAPAPILAHLLRKDVLLYALRGVKTADEFIDHAFPAYESSSEETMWGNTWHKAIANAAPRTVGGGDLRTERDGTLWIIELKLGPQNANAVAQDLRSLRAKVRAETEHHPGRRSVDAMYAFVRGEPRDMRKTYWAKSPANKDIDGWSYQHMVGLPFLRWISADFDPAVLVERLSDVTAALPGLRERCLATLKEMLDERLRRAGLASDISGVMALSADLGTRRRNSSPKDQSSA
ncbi:MAG: PmeII family type II restriction endonuclease [Dehalococcoidia bacterium]